MPSIATSTRVGTTSSPLSNPSPPSLLSPFPRRRSSKRFFSRACFFQSSGLGPSSLSPNHSSSVFLRKPLAFLLCLFCTRSVRVNGRTHSPSPTVGRYRRRSRAATRVAARALRSLSSRSSSSPGAGNSAGNTMSTDATTTLGWPPLGGWLAKCPSARGFCRSTSLARRAADRSISLLSIGLSMSSYHPTRLLLVGLTGSSAGSWSTGAPGQTPNNPAGCPAATLAAAAATPPPAPAAARSVPRPHGVASMMVPSYRRMSHWL
mmetsp:Transcript_27542/g.68960  ORF Transcript_27542/g.68960 Transcript_27542/m.68960 type:complete len:263 (-) Transcript_27542:601-1389(-)